VKPWQEDTHCLNMRTQTDNTTPHCASEYDESVRKTIPFYDDFHAETIDLVKTVKPDATVWLDTGCGTGSLVLKAFSDFTATLFILSDPSENMLQQARQRLAHLPQTQFLFLEPVGSEDLLLNGIKPPDVITAIQSHHYLSAEIRQRATQRCFDLLAPGGMYVTFENICPNSDQGIEIGLTRWKQYQMSQGKDEKQAAEHGQRFNKAYFPIRLDQHFRLLTHCGFSVVELLWYSHLQAGFYAIK
jgi:tRNA (cmo5U34)-methyltransferase